MILKNKIAIITGGANGIGRAAVETMAKEGAKVIFCDTNKLQGIKNQKRLNNMGLETFFVNADVSKESHVKKVINYTINNFKKIDITNRQALDKYLKKKKIPIRLN